MGFVFFTINEFNLHVQTLEKLGERKNILSTSSFMASLSHNLTLVQGNFKYLENRKKHLERSVSSICSTCL